MAYIPPTDWELRDFYREHADTVYRSCMLFTNGQADCRLMTKEIFLKLLDRGMEFSTTSDAKAWMILSAYKRRRSAIRAAKKQTITDVKVFPESNEITDLQSPAEEDTTVSVDNGDIIESSEENVLSQDMNRGADETESVFHEEEASCDDGNEAEPGPEICPDENDCTPEVVAEEEALEDTVPSCPVFAIPESEVTTKESHVYPQEVLKLSGKDRLVAVLYYCEGFRKTEIASYLGCTVFAVRRILKRISRKIPEANGGLLLRVYLRDAYQNPEFCRDDKELLMEEIVNQRLKTTDRRSRKWRHKGQWGSWLLIILAVLLVLSVLYQSAEYFGIMDQIREKTQQIAESLEEAASAEDTLPPNPQETDMISDNAQPTKPAEEIYDPYVLRYIEALEQAWDPGRCAEEDISFLVGFLNSPDQLNFVLTDLDGNGVDELLITDGRVIYDLYTYSGERVTHVISGAERNSYMLSTDNVIINHASGSAAYSVYGFYRFIGGALVVDQLVVLDAATDPQNPWFHGFIEEDLRPISEVEANQIISSYENVSIGGTPLTLWKK